MKLLRKSMYLFITFIGIAYFLSINLSIIRNNEQIIIDKKGYFSDNSYSIKIKESKIKNDIFEKLNKIENDFILYKNDNIFSSGKSIYFSEKAILPKFSLIEGRFFNQNDISSRNKYIIIGKNLKQESFVENNKRYYIINSQKYEVIGILGYEKNKSGFDDFYFVNMSSYYFDKNFYFNGEYILDFVDTKNNSIKEFEKNIKEWDKNAQIEITKQIIKKSLLTSSINEFNFYSIFTLVILGILSLNIISMTMYWINSRKQEYSVRKAYGSTNIKLVFRFIFQYEFIITLAFIVGLILYIISIKLNLFNFIDNTLYFSSIGLGYVLCLFLGIITGLVPVYKIIKLQVREILR